MQIQAVFPKLAIEALDEGVPGRFTRLDEMQLYAGLLRPEERGIGVCPLLAVLGSTDCLTGTTGYAAYTSFAGRQETVSFGGIPAVE